MSTSRVQQAVAAALALGAAAAANAAQVDITTVPAANVLYVSGSTAIDPGLTSYFLAGGTAPCSSAVADPSPTFYSGTIANKKFIAVACTGAPGSTFAGTPIAIVKEDNGGSQFGIDPVRDNSALPLTGTNPNFFPDTTTLTAGGNCAALAVPPAATVCAGAYGTVTTHSNLGFADVDPAMFQDSQGTATLFNTLDVVFAAAVNVGLYHELQALQGFAGDAAAQMPVLTKSQLSGLFNGAITSWATINPALTTTAVAWGTSGGTTFGASAAPSSTTVFICQRGQSSGSERSAEIFFEGQNCSTGGAGIAAAIPSSCQADGCTWTTAFNADKNFAGNGTGDLLACLQGQDKLGHLAIGFASIDNPWGTFQGNTARRDFRYIRYNDAVPSIETAAAGVYDFWVQSVGIAPGAGNGNIAAGVAGNVAAFLQTGANRVGSVTSIANLNATHVYEAGNWDAGFLAIPDGTAAIPNATNDTVVAFEANPVNTGVKNGKSGASNNCQAPGVSSFAPSSSGSPTWLIPAVF